MICLDFRCQIDSCGAYKEISINLNISIPDKDPQTTEPMTDAIDEESLNLNSENIQPEPKPDMTDKNEKREKSWFGKKCVKIFRVFTNTFGMTFLAEWGDRLVNFSLLS